MFSISVLWAGGSHDSVLQAGSSGVTYNYPKMAASMNNAHVEQLRHGDGNVTIFPKNDSLLKSYCQQLQTDKQVQEQLGGWRQAWREQHQPNQFGPSAHAPNPMQFPALFPPTTGFIHPTMHQQTWIPSAHPIVPPPPPPTRTTPAPLASARTSSQKGKPHMCKVCGERKWKANGHIVRSKYCPNAVEANDA
jgi:hypothetical protein